MSLVEREVKGKVWALLYRHEVER